MHEIHDLHYVKSVQIWSFFWSVFSHPYLVRMWEKTDQKKNPCFDTFHTVLCFFKWFVLQRFVSYRWFDVFHHGFSRTAW